MTNAEKIQSKIFDESGSIISVINRWKEEGKKIVFTNGCFDILHKGHIHYLCRAADMGDKFIVGLNSDQSVRKLKGGHRPLNDKRSRMEVLASLLYVDAIVIFDEETPLDLIEKIKPDILVKGGDYREEQIAGYDVVRKYGGKVIIMDFIPGYSTSLIEKKIIEQFQKKS
jgi:rfaE bifunctional protein nucleotidyltransferase chain/domain